MRSAVVTVAILLTTTVVATAATPASPQPRGINTFGIDWYTMDGGGGYSSNPTFELAGTIAQADAGVISGAGFEIRGGFWAGVPQPCSGNANGDGQVDLSDLALVLTQFGEIGPTLSGDVDFDGDVDLSDLAIVLVRFGEPC